MLNTASADCFEVGTLTSVLPVMSACPLLRIRTVSRRHSLQRLWEVGGPSPGCGFGRGKFSLRIATIAFKNRCSTCSQRQQAGAHLKYAQSWNHCLTPVSVLLSSPRHLRWSSGMAFTSEACLGIWCKCKVHGDLRMSTEFGMARAADLHPLLTQVSRRPYRSWNMGIRHSHCKMPRSVLRGKAVRRSCRMALFSFQACALTNLALRRDLLRNSL